MTARDELEQQALTVQERVLDRLALQLAAVERAIVVVGVSPLELEAEASALGSTNSRGAPTSASDRADHVELAAEARARGPAQELEPAEVRRVIEQWEAAAASEPELVAHGESERSIERSIERAESARALPRGRVDDRWSAPLALARAAAPAKHGVAVPRELAEPDTADGERVAERATGDRWSLPLRPSLQGRGASEPSVARRRGSIDAPLATTARTRGQPSSSRGESAEHELASALEHRDDAPPTSARADRPRPSLAGEQPAVSLPDPLRLSSDWASDLPTGSAGASMREQLRSRSTSEPHASPEFTPRARTSARAAAAPAELATREQLAGVQERPREQLAITRERPPTPDRTLDPSTHASQPASATTFSLGLDDELDELARLEERMADVLERVLLEIGVDP